MHPNRLHILILGAFALLPIATATNASGQAPKVIEMPAGSVVEHTVYLGKKLVPLPTGKWELLFSSRMEPPPNTRNTENIDRVFLVQKKDGRYAAGMLISSNRESGEGGGWPRPTRVCDRKNVHFNVSDRRFDATRADCWQLNHMVNVYNMPREPVFWRAKRWARTRLKTSTFLALQFRLNDAFGLVAVDILINPVALGFPPDKDSEWRRSIWHKEFMAGDPNKEATVAWLKDTGARYHTRLQQGFRGDLRNYVSDISIFPDP